MGLFDFLKKKKEPAYDVTNLSIRDLNVGFILDYNLKSWVVKEVYEYDWGDHNFSAEYKLDSGDEVVYMHVEDRGELRINVTKTIKIRSLGEDIIDYAVEHEHPPKKLVLNDVKYYMHSDNAGYFNHKSAKSRDWEELVSWEYYDDNEEHIICITQWNDRDFDAVAGKVIKEYEISNIVPASS